MIVFVQNNQVAANTGLLARAARDLGMTVIDTSFPWRDTPTPPDERNVFVYGSVAFAKTLRSLPGWQLHVAWSESAFRADRWAVAYGDSYIGHAGRIVASADVTPLLPAAVRPLQGDKAFAGGVYSATDWTPPEIATPAWVAPIAEISKEVRVWIVDGRPVCAGQYKPSVSTFDLAELAAVIASLSPLPLERIVADFALTPAGWKLVEFNCINTAGLYAIDPADLLHAMARPAGLEPA